MGAVGYTALITFVAEYLVDIFVNLCLYVKCTSQGCYVFTCSLGFCIVIVIVSLMRIEKNIVLVEVVQFLRRFIYNAGNLHSIDVPSTVEAVRRQRSGMVQTEVFINMITLCIAIVIATVANILISYFFHYSR